MLCIQNQHFLGPVPESLLSLLSIFVNSLTTILSS
jgi:hypothetical protein